MCSYIPARAAMAVESAGRHWAVAAAPRRAAAPLVGSPIETAAMHLRT